MMTGMRSITSGTRNTTRICPTRLVADAILVEKQRFHPNLSIEVINAQAPREPRASVQDASSLQIAK
jgi:hypothetical protein